MKVHELIKRTWTQFGGPNFGIDPTRGLGSVEIIAYLTKKQIKELTEDILSKKDIYLENVNTNEKILFEELLTYPFHYYINESNYFELREKVINYV